jgi:leader peptidase (prepilin peptidase)/N-methyltransferase
VAVPDWIWFVFVFAFGCCIGSFLNVVVYRMPRDKSLVTPPSSCPACGRHIRFYDNVPLVSWLVLGRKCRYCKAPVSPRYFIIELLTGVIFLGLFILYFRIDSQEFVQPFSSRCWFIYVLHIILLAAFVAASAIDLEHWVIPLSICWLVTAVGFVGSAVGAYYVIAPGEVIASADVRSYYLLPSTADIIFTDGTAIASLAVGAAIGLAISTALLMTGLVKRSYESDNPGVEALREIIFLLPIIGCSLLALWIGGQVEPVSTWWSEFSQHPVVSGLLGSVWGYFVGCGIVWGIRIFGTLAFGKEAMGLGDVHLMGAAGAVVGPLLVVVAFFIAPFFGLAWAGSQMFFKKVRQIPYGPFLSLGIFVVMIFHDWILNRVGFLFYR